jgi:alpha-N-arabinofuranosidase
VTTYRNPIIPGFHPDPSVCRVGEDYYLVTSSFEFFPGVPVFHSRDLVNWRQIGHCLTRKSQLELGGARPSGGIFAPTIRHHAGRFYMVTTNVTHRGNFYVTASDPAGPWSEPTWVEQGGIDPSLLFDTDGKVYFTSTAGGITQSTIDIATGALLTKPTVIWGGTGGRYPEGPHLYHLGDTYYLLISEGGTEYGHMVTVARSKHPYGPFEPCPNNPIFTHRDRGAHPIQGTGHADLVEATDGSFWMVHLAFRSLYRNVMPAHHLGRETFLVPVTFRDGWPVPGDPPGAVELEMKAPPWPLQPFAMPPARDDFDQAELPLQYNYLRNPDEAASTLTARPGWLRLHGSATSLNDIGSPAWVGRRQEHFACDASVLLDYEPGEESEEAGLVAYRDDGHHYEVAVTRRDGRRVVVVRRRIGDLVVEVGARAVEAGPVRLRISATEEKYSFHYGSGTQGQYEQLAQGDTRYLSTEVAGGFIGNYLAMYATGHGKPCRSPADFDWFEYVGR